MMLITVETCHHSLGKGSIAYDNLCKNGFTNTQIYVPYVA